MRSIQRLAAMFLALILCFSTLPVSGFAAEDPQIPDVTPTETEAPAPSEEPIPSEEPVPSEEPAPSEEPEETAEAAEAPEAVAAVTFFPSGGQVDTSRNVSVTLSCATEGAVIYYALSADGKTYGEYLLYEAPIPLNPGFGTLYIKARAEKERCLSDKQAVCVYTEAQVSGWDLYFGQLHSHCDVSDGQGTVQQAFETAAAVEGLDFFAVTDHSDSFDNADAGSIAADAAAVSTEWASGKEAAAAVTNAQFVGIYGYEMSWHSGMGLGHIGTFNTPGFQSWLQPDFNDHDSGLINYYNALTTVPDSISQFNHPGTFYGDFLDFGHYSAACDKVITLLEVGSGSDLPDAYESYTRALDAGWHVAPTNNQNEHTGQFGAGSSRTVVYAESLTEEGIYDALRNYRVYATEDRDLSIFYRLDEHLMGSLLERRDVGETVTISAKLSDPTDIIGTVEVIVDGGLSIARETVDAASATVTLEVPAEYSYYYLRITQPDGDTAVTAPVWIDGVEDVGISGFSAGTAVPVQGEPLSLSLELFNNEADVLTVESVVFSIGDKTLHTANMGTLEQGQTKRCTFALTYNGLGYTQITATVTAMLGGVRRTYQETLTLSFRLPEMVTQILVDGTHGNIPSFARLTALAEDNQINVIVETEKITAKMLENSSMLIVPAPERAFEGEFLALIQEYAGYGGRLLVCGRSDMGDGELHAAGELNRLLAAAGSTLRICDDTARDGTNNGGTETALYLAEFNGSWCETVTADQVYRQVEGCTVEPGSGTWLVKGYATTTSADGDGDGQGGGNAVVLACEGRIFAAGSLFVSDEDLAGPKNIWDAPYANRTILKAILGDTEAEMPLSSILDAKSGEIGQVYRIRGYVTAGTANPYNTFPDTLYVQDDTGGIAVVPFRESGISVGTAVDMVGCLSQQDGNPVLELISYDILDVSLYNYQPLEDSWPELLDNALHGGQLVQVKGEVVQILYSGDTVSELLLKDRYGNSATVHIEDYIFSGTTGENNLAQEIQVGQTARAMGILYQRGDGVTVVRVRNCDEVVYVPPINYVWKQPSKDNPRVGDTIGIPLAAAALSGALLLKKRKRK